MNRPEKDMSALKGCLSELELFKSRVNKYCNKLEMGIVGCSELMVGESSMEALKNGSKAAQEIRNCLFPIDRIIEKLDAMIDGPENNNEYDKA